MAVAGKITITEPVILAIETSGTCGSVSLVAPGHCIAEYSLCSKTTHSRRLLAGIDWIMSEAGIDWPQINGIAVALGPGSFTGLRIGLSTAKGLAMASCAPLLGIPTLDALAYQLFATPHQICPLLDARKQEVYTAFYQGDSNGLPHRTSEYMVITPEKLAEKITAPTVFIGEGLTVYGEYLEEKLGKLALLAPAEVFAYRAASVGMLAIERWRAKDFLSPAKTVPIYVRLSEAELNRNKYPSPAKALL